MLVYFTLCTLTAAVVLAETELTPVTELDSPYCAVRYRRLCQGKGPHVACQFALPGPGDSCVNYIRIKFTKDLRHTVTHYINRRRQRLATGFERVRGGVHPPRPEVMMQVEWDKELALLAQRLANQCNFVHDDCRATVRFPYAGQTVGEVKWRRSSESDAQNVARAIRRVLDAWWGERRRVTAKQLTQPFRLTNKGNVWGHFSQLAVWTLRAVGCGAVKHGLKSPRILLVCDFSHTNMLGQRTIVPGPLGPCPIHMARRPRSPYPTLCAPVRSQDEEKEEPEINTHSPIAHESHYRDENHDIYYDDDDPDNDIPFANTTHPPISNKYTKMTEQKQNTRKIIRVNNWGETDFEQESVGNHISRDKDVKGKISDKAIIDDQTDTLGAINKHSHPHQQIIDRSKIQNYEEMFQRSDIDGISNEKNDRFHEESFDRDKIREKSQQHETHYDIDKSHHKPALTFEQLLPNYGPNKFRTNDLRKPGTSNNPVGDLRGKTATEESQGTGTEFYEPVGARHRWRPAKDRPERPGAKALFNTGSLHHTTTRAPAPTKNSIKFASIMMDKEDVEQLFKDTGFNLGWRRYRKIPS